jgi:hypothetical protein
MMATVWLLGMVISVSGWTPAAAQTPPAQPVTPPAPSARLRVFLDCDCFEDHLRNEIRWVDFVRQPQDADVHLLSTDRETGGGGQELVLRFVGRGRFADASQELRVITEVAAAESVRRDQVLRTVIVGLLNFMARDSLPRELELDVETPAAAAPSPGVVRDPWNLWVFSVSTGASYDAEESNRESQWNVNLTADRVTDMWKLAVGLSVDEEREIFNLDEDDEAPLEVRRIERSTQWFAARSLGPHWSFGVDGELASSTFGNTRLLAQTAPAVEYSIFPYREYATRQFVFQYEIGVEHARYNELTVFNRLRETNGRHALSANLDVRQPWGSLDAGIEWSQYLHDPSKYRLEFDGEVSLQLVRGLSLDLEGSVSRIRDQLSLPRRGATPEEVLLQLRELESGYEVRFEFGIRYSFGSLFNNVVNPRFGNRGTLDDDDNDFD